MHTNIATTEALLANEKQPMDGCIMHDINKASLTTDERIASKIETRRAEISQLKADAKAKGEAKYDMAEIQDELKDPLN